MTIGITGTTTQVAQRSEVTPVSESAPTGDGPSRRRVFAMCSLGVLGVAGLAACSSDDAADTAAVADSTTAAATTSAAAETTAASASTSLVALADVPVGGAVSVEADGKPVIVAQPTANEVVAFSAVCPHKFVTVVVSGEELLCPAHGSTFEQATGKNLTGPAAGKGLPAIEVKVVDGEVVQA